MTKARVFPNWKDAILYDPTGPQHQKLIETDAYKAVLVGMESGQVIPPHPAADASYHFLEGTGWMVVDGERWAVEGGATVVVPAGASRGVEAGSHHLAFIGTHATPGASAPHRMPFRAFGVVAAAGVILMLGLMALAGWLAFTQVPLSMLLSSQMGIGMIGVMLVPAVGLVLMVAAMYILPRKMMGGMSAGGHMSGASMQHGHDLPVDEASNSRTLTYQIPAVRCGHCKMTIEREVGGLAGVTSVQVDVDRKRAVIHYGAPATQQAIEVRLTEIGYAPAGL